MSSWKSFICIDISGETLVPHSTWNMRGVPMGLYSEISIVIVPLGVTLVPCMIFVEEYLSKVSAVFLKLRTQFSRTHVLPMPLNIYPGWILVVDEYTDEVNDDFAWMSQTVTVISGEVMPLHSALNV